MEEKCKIIPTSYKNKIPHSLSYACSAKMLSLAWQDVPQFEEFDLLFHCDVPKALDKTHRCRSILYLRYSQWRPSKLSRFQEQREDGRFMWNIYVHVCRREDAGEVRGWLRDVGLEQARLWLERPARSHEHWLATFDEDSRAFEIQHS